MHRKNSRNNGLLLKLPHVSLESGGKTFHFQGATLFNSLPKPIRKIDDFNEFKCALNLYFNSLPFLRQSYLPRLKLK